MCVRCGSTSVISHCTDAARCGWWLCEVCLTRFDPEKNRWVHRFMPLSEEGLSSSS